MRRTLEAIISALAGAMACSLGWSAVLPDQAHSGELGRAPVYYGGLECFRSIEPVSDAQ